MFEPQNILVIDFGQLGDVVLSLPALRAVRERFPQAKVTVAVGKAAVPVVEMSGYADKVLAVDRVGLRDGSKIVSVLKIAKLVKDVRRERFDFVIDLHSLSETNLLGYLSRAKHRLYARRPGRSLDFLSNFRPHAAVEDSSKHAVDRYLDVIAPLRRASLDQASPSSAQASLSKIDVSAVDAEASALRVPVLRTVVEADKHAEKLFKTAKLRADEPLVGLFPGAGHPGRRWSLENFIELARRLRGNDAVRVCVILGPEERELAKELRARLDDSAIVFDRLTIPQLASVLARLAVFVSNDTGPLHVAAALGTPVVMLIGRETPNSFTPVGAHHRVIYTPGVEQITIEMVYQATRELLVTGRTESLFAS